MVKVADKQGNNRQKRGPGKKFTKGKSGNPKGRPKKEACVTTQIKALMDEVPDVLPNSYPNTKKLTWARIVAEKMVLEAASGNGTYLRETMERAEGKVVEHIKVGPEVMPTDEAADILGMLNGRKVKN